MCRIQNGVVFLIMMCITFLGYNNIPPLCMHVIFSSTFIVICPEHPTPPTLREPITTTPSTVTLEVDHRNTCFENCTFQYEVKVHPAGSHVSMSTTTHSTNVFSMSGLSGSTRYRAEIVAVCLEESTIRSNSLVISCTTRMEGDLGVFDVVLQL